MNVRAVIVDDEELARQMIREYLADFPNVEVAAECADGREAVQTIEDLAPDLVFLDIQMPEMSGFEVLKHLQTLPAIVFSTAYDRYALQAFEVNAVDYLLKPYDRKRFREAVSRALERLERRQPVSDEVQALLQSLKAGPREPGRLWVKEGGSLVPIREDRIDWIEAADDYACLHVGNETHLVAQTMTALEARLDPHKFMRIHRSAIVNLDRVREIQAVGDGRYQVILKDGTRLALSRSQAKKLRGLTL